MRKIVKRVGRVILVMTVFLATLFPAPTFAAESKVASPSFGDPISDEAANIKVTGDAAKCKPGDSGCKVIGYRCYQGAKRKYYVHTESECGVEDDGEVCTTDSDGKTVCERKNVMFYLNRVINVILGLIGFIAIVMIIIGGISYTTSQGDAAKTAKAKNTILFSIVGLVVALLAFAIVNFVLNNVFK